MSQTEKTVWVLIVQDVDGEIEIRPMRSIKAAREVIEEACAEYARTEWNWTVTDDLYDCLTTDEIAACLKSMSEYGIFYTLVHTDHLFEQRLTKDEKAGDRSTHIRYAA
jgi:hypothetical protein